MIKYSVLSFTKMHKGCKLVAKKEIKDCCLKAADSNPATEITCTECDNALFRTSD